MEDSHFSQIFKFICMITIFGMLLSSLVIFLPIPKDNQRFADTAVIFWLSTAVSSGVGYLLGNSASTGKRKSDAEQFIKDDTSLIK